MRKIENIYLFTKSGLPDKTMTKEDWETAFYEMRTKIYSHAKRKSRFSNKSLLNSDVSYCSTLNDILKNIRKGGEDYCYFVYQIADLLSVEPNLNAVWNASYECFVVSLKNPVVKSKYSYNTKKLSA